MTELPDRDDLLADVPPRHEHDPWVHHYVSTACLHAINDGDEAIHTACRNVCKYCPVVCQCSCHGDAGTQPGRTSQVDQARDIARELYAAIERECRSIMPPSLDARLETDPALFWLRGEEHEPGRWTPPEETP